MERCDSGVSVVSNGINSVVSSSCSCADPESFVRGGPTLRTFFRGDRIQTNTTISGLSSPNNECWLGSFVNFPGIGPVLLRNPIFRMGGSGSLSLRWVRQ